MDTRKVYPRRTSNSVQQPYSSRSSTIPPKNTQLQQRNNRKNEKKSTLWAILVAVFQWLSSLFGEEVGKTLDDQLRLCIASSKRRVQHTGPALSSRLAQCFTTYRWHPATMASHFEFTCAIMENNAFQGSLHTFLRHGSQWRRIIPNLNRNWNQLSPALKKLVEKVERGSITIDQFLADFAGGLDQNMSVFSGIQQEILSFIKKNLSQENFLSEGLNMKGQKRVNFSVKGNGQRVWIMTVCVSDPAMQANYAFSRDQRPIRSIVTVFFKPKDGSFWKWAKLILLAILVLIFVRYVLNVF